jgi:hypothetical protein
LRIERIAQHELRTYSRGSAQLVLRAPLKANEMVRSYRTAPYGSERAASAPGADV